MNIDKLYKTFTEKLETLIGTNFPLKIYLKRNYVQTLDSNWFVKIYICLKKLPIKFYDIENTPY